MTATVTKKEKYYLVEVFNDNNELVNTLQWGITVPKNITENDYIESMKNEAKLLS